MVPRRARGARTAARRVGQRPGQPLGDPGGGQRGDEHGVGAVDRPPVLVVQPDGDLGHVARGQDAEGADGQVDRLAGVVHRDALAPHHAERLVHGAERVGAQRDRAEHLARPHVDVDAAALPSPRRSSTPARPAPGTATSARPVPSRVRPARRARGAPPAPRPSRRRAARATPAGRPPRPPRPDARAQLGDAAPATAPGRPNRPCGRRGRRRCRRGAARRPAAGAWARAAPRPRAATGCGRSRRSRRPAPRARAGHRAVPLPAEGAAVGQRRGGRAAGPAPAGVGLDVGGLDPGRLQRERPVARRHLDGVRQRHRAVAALDASGARPGRPDPGRQSGVGAELDQRVGRRGVVGEAAATEDDVAPRGLEGRPLDLGPPGRQHGIAGPAPREGRAGRRGRARRTAASTIDCHPVQRHRWARRPASTSRRVTVDARLGSSSSAARRITMPGVQKPHWLAPDRTKAAAQRSRSSAGSPSSVVTRRPATRRTGVTQATRGAPSTQTVQHPHWPCGLQPSFTERQPSSSRSASRSEIPSATATSSPLRTNETLPAADRWRGHGVAAGSRECCRCRSGGRVP